MIALLLQSQGTQISNSTTDTASMAYGLHYEISHWTGE